MSEVQRRQDQSPLVTERGTTSIKDSVVSQIAGMAAREVEGVYMGGSASRTAGNLLGSITGSDSQTRGVSVSVGRVEAAIDLTMGIDYGRNFLETVEEVRRRITERVESMTGLRVVECNATISDVIFPDGEDGRRGELESGGAESAPEPRTMPSRELRPGARERGYTEVGPRNRTHTESQSGPVPEEEVRVEGRPLDEDETAILRVDEDETTAEDETREFDRRPLEDEDETERGSRRGGS
jgi:uncharacterized alkaline shock family protein YloU